MPIESKKQSQAKQEWMKANSRMFAIRVMKNTEADLWEFLHSVDSPGTTIKAALREYIENHKND